MPRDLLRYYPTPGRGSAERGGAGKNRDGGTSRTPSPTGRLRVGRGCVNGYAQASVTQKPVGVGVPDDPLFRRPRGKNKQYNEKSRLLGRGPTPAPTYDDRQRTGVAYFFAPRIQIINAAPRAAFSPFCATAMRIAIKNAPAGRFHSSRGADTLAAEWVLRASGRGGRGCQPYGGAEAQKAHFFGAPPRFFWQGQRNGVDKQHNVKPNQQQTGELLQAKLPPGGYVRAIPPIWADMRRSV